MLYQIHDLIEYLKNVVSFPKTQMYLNYWHSSNKMEKIFIKRLFPVLIFNHSSKLLQFIKVANIIGYKFISIYFLSLDR